MSCVKPLDENEFDPMASKQPVACEEPLGRFSVPLIKRVVDGWRRSIVHHDSEMRELL